MALFLTALTFDGLDPWLTAQGATGPVAVLTNASRALPDRTAIVAMATAELAAGARPFRCVDVVADGVRALDGVGAVLLTGGDPFALLADLRASGADRRLIEAHGAGLPIAGQSAGAMVCGSDLDPLRITSPFAAPVDLALRGLALTTTLVLPHHGQPGRSGRHRRAALASADAEALGVLWDDEVLLLDGDAWTLWRGPLCTRPARPADTAAVADVFQQAARAAWAPFLGHQRLRQAPADTDAWRARITAGGHRFLVTEDQAGVVAFVCWRSSSEPATGEIDLLYTHPRAWGSGLGRRLLERATWWLLCEGFREAVLWTEARNSRALAVYHANGWRHDGAVEEREYLGVPIRNLRHRLDLTRHAGG